jgi:glycosyltransferase involved in cell wall biosynthesis
MPEATLLVAGNDEDGYVLKLKALAAALGVQDRVSFLPRQIGGADKEALFVAARVLALPSISENFGNVVLEALIRGKPVAVTKGVGAAEIVTASNAGIVTSNDVGEFASALTNLLSSEDQRNRMGQAGAAYVRQHHTWEQVALRFDALYQRVFVAKHPPVSASSG